MYDYGDGNIESNYAQGAPPKDGWQQSGQLVTGNSDRIVMLQAAFPESGTYTVEIGVTPPLLQSRFFVAEAEIVWKVEGGFVRRVISVIDGATISGVGQAVSVTIRDVSIDPGAAIVLGETYTVYIQVARGSRPSVEQPPRLIRPSPSTLIYSVTSIGPTASQVFDVPEDAGVISVYIGAANIVAATPTEFYAIMANPGQNVMIVKDPVGWIPLVPGTNTVTLTNLDAVNNLIVTLIWGIDG